MCKLNVGHKTSGNNSPITGDINNDVSVIYTKIVELEQELTKCKKKYEKRSFFDTTIGIIITIFAGAIVFFALAICANEYFHFGLSGDSIVLTFVGIASTFVVVSNYVQVKDIESKFKNEIDKMKNDIESKFKNEIDKMKNDIENEIQKNINTVDGKIINLENEYRNDKFVKAMSKTSDIPENIIKTIFDLTKKTKDGSLKWEERNKGYTTSYLNSPVFIKKSLNSDFPSYIEEERVPFFEICFSIEKIYEITLKDDKNGYSIFHKLYSVIEKKVSK